MFLSRARVLAWVRVRKWWSELNGPASRRDTCAYHNRHMFEERYGAPDLEGGCAELPTGNPRTPACTRLLSRSSGPLRRWRGRPRHPLEDLLQLESSLRRSLSSAGLLMGSPRRLQHSLAGQVQLKTLRGTSGQHLEPCSKQDPSFLVTVVEFSAQGRLLLRELRGSLPKLCTQC